MERQFCINWPAIVEEAKQRRKKQGLTQKRLADMAGVSTPTLSRFESGEKDIQLSSIVNILTVLGMNDQRNLIFLDQPIQYARDRKIILFFGEDGDKKITCAISKEALTDHFNNDKDLLKTFHANRKRIEHEARRKYLAGQLEANGDVLVRTEDIDNQ